MFEQAEGKVQEIAGKVQDAVGGAAGNADLQAEGKLRQAAGKVQQGYGAVLDNLREAAITSPLTTIAVVATVGFIAGALWSRRD